MLPLVTDEDVHKRGDFEPYNVVNLPLIEKEDIRKKKKSKRERYGYLKGRVLKLVPWIYSEIDRSDNWRKEITMRARDVAKDLGLESKSDAAIYSGLRFLLYYEGIGVHIKNNGKENFFTMRKLDGFGGEGFPQSVLKTFDNMDLDGWYIKRQRDFLTVKHSIRKEFNKDIGWTYILESDGNIYFDRRNLTEDQAIEFAKYMSGKDYHAPDFVYLTPVNVVLTDEYLRNRYRNDNFDPDKVGREFRVVKSGDGFTVTSIYGKECEIQEFEVDSLIKGCNIHSILSAFDNIINIERAPERIEILKKILPGIKSKNIVILQGKKLIITNSIGTFNISIVDGTLHKIYAPERKQRPKYICVGSVHNRTGGFIIYNGNKYKIDGVTDTILAKMHMLLDEKYPDETTIRQILT